MQTVITSSPAEAAEFIKRGGIVAFPTETVYGLGANVFDTAAVAKIFEAKRRPADNPLIAHIANLEQVHELALEVTESAEKFIQHFFPGPLTVVLKKKNAVPTIATAGLDTIGIRMPKFGIANQFLRACGVPVVAPSANISGSPSPTTFYAVLEDLDERIDCILKGEPTEIGLESTVVDCSGDAPQLLREGAVSLKQLRSVVREVSGIVSSQDAPRSPGMRHRHYSPAAKVVLIDRGGERMPNVEGSSGAYIGVKKPEGDFRLVKICSSVEDYAHSVFEFFRECDRVGIKAIYCETVKETGIGSALMDRLQRSAES